MSRKSRIFDKTNWKLPSIYGFVGDYGPIKIKGYEPLDNVSVLLVNTSDDSSISDDSDDSPSGPSNNEQQQHRHHHHPMYDIAGQIQKLILKLDGGGRNNEDDEVEEEEENDNDPYHPPLLDTTATASSSGGGSCTSCSCKFLVLDIKDMFDSYEEYQLSLKKEIPIPIPIITTSTSTSTTTPTTTTSTTSTSITTSSNSNDDDDGTDDDDDEQPPPPAAATATVSSTSSSVTTATATATASTSSGAELTKGFGKSLLRILQRLLLQNCTLIAYGELSLLILKLYKSVAYTIDPDMISNLILIHPPPITSLSTTTKFIENLGLKKKVVVTKNNNNTDNTSENDKNKKLNKKNGNNTTKTRKINSKRQQQKALKKKQQQQQQQQQQQNKAPPTLHLILDNDEDDKGNSQQQQQQLETILRSYFPIGTTTVFPSSASSTTTDDTINNNNNNTKNECSSRCCISDLGIILSGCKKKKRRKDNSNNNNQYYVYDPEYYNPLGQRLFCSQITIEMNKYSKQYERICEDITSKLMEIIVVVVVKKKKKPTEQQPTNKIAEDANAETHQKQSIDWSTCERHIGALVLRGNRCVLIRSLQNEEWIGMRLPSVVPLDNESPKEACWRAIEQYTEVDAKNECQFLQQVNPVKIYDIQRQLIIELYALVAIEPPPDGPLEDADIEDDETLYDWYTYHNAIKRLQSEEGNKLHIICGLQIMSLSLIQAANVGLIEVKWGGIFGQEMRLGICDKDDDDDDDDDNNHKNNNSIIGGGSSLLTVPVEEWEQQQQQQQNGTSNNNNHHHNHHHHDDKRAHGGETSIARPSPPMQPPPSHTTPVVNNNNNNNNNNNKGSQPGDVVGKFEKPKQEEEKREFIESSKTTDNITTPSSPSINNSKKKLPVTILSGFLGSGKTTLMSHILTNIQGLKVAILVNDMGEINIDAALLQKNNVGITQREENLVEMSNGCICCTLREDLLIEITNIATSAQNFDYLLIESSGISEPMPVAETFTFEDHNTGTSLGDIAEIDTLVTVVDGSRFLQELDSLDSLRQRNWHADPEDQRTISHLLCDQVEFANVIVLNKCDLLTSDEKGKIIRVIQSMNPTSNLVESTYSSVDLNRVLGTKLFSMSEAEKHEGWLQEARIGEHKPESEEYGIGSFTYRSLKPFHPNKLYKTLEMMVSTSTTMTKSSTSGGDDDDDDDGNGKSIILRAKGFVWIANRPHVQGDFSLAGSNYTLLPGNPWWAVIERSEWPPNLEQAIAPLWHEPYGDRQQEIVIIGQSLNVSKITKQLDDCLMTDEQFKLGQEAWFDLLEGTDDPFSSTWDVVVENDAHADHDHHHDHGHDHVHRNHDGHHSNQGCTDEDCGDDNCNHQHDHQHSHEHCHDH